jgi:hypothetical protein
MSLLIGLGVLVALYAISRAFPPTLIFIIVALGACFYEMSPAATHGWGAVIVLAFILDVIGAAFARRGSC